VCRGPTQGHGAGDTWPHFNPDCAGAICAGATHAFPGNSPVLVKEVSHRAHYAAGAIALASTPNCSRKPAQPMAVTCTARDARSAAASHHRVYWGWMGQGTPRGIA